MRGAFRSRQRIRRRTEFQKIYDQGRRAHGRFMTLVVLPNSSPVSRLGISATRKLGNAVQRNVAKRRIREIFRTHVTAPSADIVVIPRPGLFSASFEDLVADYCAILERQTRGPSRGSRQRSRD